VIQDGMVTRILCPSRCRERVRSQLRSVNESESRRGVSTKAQPERFC
jgi:hypothetical protein